MDSECSLLRLQPPATVSCPDSDESSLHPREWFHKDQLYEEGVQCKMQRLLKCTSNEQ